MSFGCVGLYAKFFLILYPWTENSITGNAITITITIKNANQDGQRQVQVLVHNNVKREGRLSSELAKSHCVCVSCKPSSYSTNLGDGSKWENPNFNTFGTNGVFAFKIPTKLNNYNVQTDKDKLVSTYFVFYVVFFLNRDWDTILKKKKLCKLLTRKNSRSIFLDNL